MPETPSTASDLGICADAYGDLWSSDSLAIDPTTPTGSVEADTALWVPKISSTASDLGIRADKCSDLWPSDWLAGGSHNPDPAVEADTVRRRPRLFCGSIRANSGGTPTGVDPAPCLPNPWSVGVDGVFGTHTVAASLDGGVLLGVDSLGAQIATPSDIGRFQG